MNLDTAQINTSSLVKRCNVVFEPRYFQGTLPNMTDINTDTNEIHKHAVRNWFLSFPLNPIQLFFCFILSIVPVCKQYFLLRSLHTVSFADFSQFYLFIPYLCSFVCVHVPFIFTTFSGIPSSS